MILPITLNQQTAQGQIHKTFLTDTEYVPTFINNGYKWTASNKISDFSGYSASNKKYRQQQVEKPNQNAVSLKLVLEETLFIM